MRILFYYPQKPVIEMFKNDKRVIFMDNYGLYEFKNGVKKNFYLKEANFKYFKKTNFPNILKKINSWIPVWSRFNDDGHFYYHNFRKILYNYIKIHSFFKKSKINKVVMFTYASHNLRSLLIDLVCAETKIKQLFFFDSGMLPGNEKNLVTGIVQKYDFKNRNFINFKLNHFNINNHFSNFKTETLEKTKNNFDQYKSYFYLTNFSYNFYLSFVYTFLFYSLENFKIRIKKIFSDSLFIDIHRYSTLNHLRVLYSQKKALQFYKKNEIDTINFIKKKDNKLIIAASIQPEASSFPESADWNHMFDILLEIRRLGYKKKIFYKEHPVIKTYTDKITKHSRKGISRNVEYYQYFKNLECSFLKLDFNLLEKKIMENSVIFAMGSTLCVERSILGYKSIYFGNPWWKGLPGTIHISKLKSLSNIDYLCGYDKKIEISAEKFLKKKLNYKLFENNIGLHALASKIKSRNSKKFKDTINKLITKF